MSNRKSVNQEFIETDKVSLELTIDIDKLLTVPVYPT